MKLNRWLLDRQHAGEPAVLVVDEAQNLTPQLLEEIRLLTNLETSTEKLLQIVLSGQPELETKLRHPQLRQLRQRITLCCRTSRLSLEETRGYIAQRLHIAGANGRAIFTAEAIERLHKYACGIPRVINVLSDHALINAFVDDRKFVTPQMVDDAAREFELFAGAPVVAGGGALGLLVETRVPVAERVAVPGRLGLQRREAQLLPDGAGALHVLALGQDRIRQRPSAFVQSKERIL